MLPASLRLNVLPPGLQRIVQRSFVSDLFYLVSFVLLVSSLDTDLTCIKTFWGSNILIL